MWQMDLAAGLAATRRARGRCATVAVEAITFLSPVQVGDEVSLYADVSSTGRTSMRVAVQAWRRPRDGDVSVRVTEAVFTFVAIDDQRRPRLIDAPEPNLRQGLMTSALDLPPRLTGLAAKLPVGFREALVPGWTSELGAD